MKHCQALKPWCSSPAHLFSLEGTTILILVFIFLFLYSCVTLIFASLNDILLSFEKPSGKHKLSWWEEATCPLLGSLSWTQLNPLLVVVWLQLPSEFARAFGEGRSETQETPRGVGWGQWSRAGQLPLESGAVLFLGMHLLIQRSHFPAPLTFIRWKEGWVPVSPCGRDTPTDQEHLTWTFMWCFIVFGLL